jgi:hypothetical protein
MRIPNQFNLFVSTSLLFGLLSEHLKPFDIHPDEINPKSLFPRPDKHLQMNQMVCLTFASL